MTYQRATGPLTATLAAAAAVACAAPPGSAQQDDLRFDAPPVSLPQPVVTALLQDRHGFVWIGTQGGLVRYDGHGTRVYTGLRTQQTRLPSSAIRGLLEHRDGRLFVATLNGLAVLDEARDSVVVLTTETRPDLFPDTDVLNDLTQFPDGRVGVALDGGGVLVLSPDLREGRHHRRGDGGPGSLPSDEVEALVTDAQGGLWVATLAGVARFDVAEGTWRAAPLEAGDAGGPDQPRRIAVDAAGTVWVGGLDGIARLDPRTGRTRRTSLASGRVQSILPIGTDTVWVGTYGGGLHRLDGQGRLVRSYGPGNGQPQTLLDGRVASLMMDRSGLLWVGLWGRGVQTADPDGAVFRFVRGGTDLAGAEVTAVRPVAGSDRMVLSTYAGGVHLMEADGTVTDRMPTGLLGPDDAPEEVLTAVAVGSDEYLVGTMHIGLVNVRAGRVTDVYPHRPGDTLSAPQGVVYDVAPDSADGYWVATSTGVARFDRPTGRFLRLAGDAALAALDGAFVRTIHRADDGWLWLGTLGEGLFIHDPASGRTVNIRSSRFESVPDDEVAAVATVGGYGWFGTRSAGTVHRVSGWADPRSPPEVELVGPEGGLGSSVQCMTPDASGALWISTTSDLVRVDPATLSLTVYGPADGVPAGEFRTSSCALARDGRVWFGQQSGVTLFHPDSLAPPSSTARTVVSTASFGPRTESAPFGAAARSIGYREGLIVFQLALLDYRSPASQTFSYRLNGEAWTPLGQESRVTFANLTPGEYTFEARGRDANGFLADPSEALAFDVLPPFFMTAWFRTLVVLLVLGVLVGLYLWRTRTIRSHNLALRREIEERERLEAQGMALEEQLRHAQKMEAVGRLTGGIAHDFNNILTVLMTNAELLVESSDDPDQRSLAAEIHESGTRAATLVRQLLVFSRRQPLTESTTSLHELLDHLAPMLRRTLGERTEVILDLPEEACLVTLDSSQMEAALLNLAINARDAMPQGGTLTFSLRRDSLQAGDLPGIPEGDWWVLGVRDTGTGIPANVMDRIFEPFFTTKPVGRGSGLGLAMVYGFVEQSGGHLRVESSPGEGTCFFLYLPPAGTLAAATHPTTPTHP